MILCLADICGSFSHMWKKDFLIRTSIIYVVNNRVNEKITYFHEIDPKFQMFTRINVVKEYYERYRPNASTLSVLIARGI